MTEKILFKEFDKLKEKYLRNANYGISITDLFEISELQELQDSFAEANNVAATITDVNGNPITKTSSHSRTCLLIRSTEKGLQNCVRSGKILGELALNSGKPNFHYCQSIGFADAAAPIMIDDVHIANWLIGQNCIGDVDEARVISYAEEIGINTNELLAAFHEIDPASEQIFMKKVDFLWKIANQLSSLAFERYILNQAILEIEKNQKKLNEYKNHLEKIVKERTKELVKANLKLEKISTTDSLTNLKNRRFAIRQLNLHFNEAKEKNKSLSCLMIDADNFKEVNDTYGHDAGDAVLKRVAIEMSDTVRSDDIVCRMGGDEFTIICPDTDLKGAMYLGEQIRKNIASLKIQAGEGFWAGSLSIGVATLDKETKKITSLLKIADESVYEAKRSGRNCVRSIQNS
jgi:diguanylate cyclase (GGDEF)-like protein